MGHYASEMGGDDDRHYESNADREKRLLENRVKGLETKVSQLSIELDAARQAIEVCNKSLQEQVRRLEELLTSDRNAQFHARLDGVRFGGF